MLYGYAICATAQMEDIEDVSQKVDEAILTMEIATQTKEFSLYFLNTSKRVLERVDFICCLTLS